MAKRQETDLPPRVGEIDLGYLEQDLSFLSRVLRTYIRNETGLAYEELEVEPGEIAITNLIGINPGVSQNDLAEALVLKKPAVTKLVKALESNGFVERRQVAADKRYNALYLTPAGESRRQTMRAICDEHQQAMLAVFSETEQSRFFSMLGRLHQHLAQRHQADSEADQNPVQR